MKVYCKDCKFYNKWMICKLAFDSLHIYKAFEGDEAYNKAIADHSFWMKSHLFNAKGKCFYYKPKWWVRILRWFNRQRGG